MKRVKPIKVLQELNVSEFFYKTQTNFFSPFMLKIWVVLAGHDMVIDTGSTSRTGANSKSHQCRKKNDKKMKKFLKNWVASRNHLKFSGNERNENVTTVILALSNDSKEHKGLKNDKQRKNTETGF